MNNVDFTKLVGFVVTKVEETKIEHKSTCMDCGSCEDGEHMLIVSFVNDNGVQIDLVYADGEPAFMSDPFIADEEDDEE